MGFPKGFLGHRITLNGHLLKHFGIMKKCKNFDKKINADQESHRHLLTNGTEFVSTALTDTPQTNANSHYWQ
jgi:hypothetical protein